MIVVGLFWQICLVVDEAKNMSTFGDTRPMLADQKRNSKDLIKANPMRLNRETLITYAITYKKKLRSEEFGAKYDDMNIVSLSPDLIHNHSELG